MTKKKKKKKKKAAAQASYGFPKTLTCQARVYNNEECSED